VSPALVAWRITLLRRRLSSWNCTARELEVIDDRRRGRCWSPTVYAAGARAGANAGVEAVSALVFDLDRVPPDPARRAHVCWIGHTTWSHRACEVGTNAWSLRHVLQARPFANLTHTRCVDSGA
jgi:hypothetical protein